MDTTLHRIASLAHYLGYGWCAGCRGQYVGHDFIRNGDSWQAYNGITLKPCTGTKSDQRLKIHYGDFGFTIKHITYGKTVIQSLAPIVFDSGKVTNSHSTPTKTTITQEIKSVRTVTHTTTSSWKSAHELGLELSYTPPGATGGVGIKGSYKFTYESSSTTTDSTSNQQWNIFKLTSEKVGCSHAYYCTQAVFRDPM